MPDYPHYGILSLSEGDKQYIFDVMKAMPIGKDSLYFPIIRQEGTKCIYAESSTGFYWYVDNAESLTERSVYK